MICPVKPALRRLPFVVLGLLSVVCLLSSAGRLDAAAAPLCTARTYTADEVRTLLPAALRARASLRRDELGAGQDDGRFTSQGYAEVDAGQLALFQGQFWAALFEEGIPTTAMRRDAGWPRFDCVDYTMGYIFRARLRHWKDDWRAPERTHPAIFRVAYRPTVDRLAPPPRAPNHCIAFLLTTEGPIFVDPQVGRVVLSEAELSTLYWPLE